MARDDISKYLVHWTKGNNYREAFDTLRAIVFESRLLGGTSHIKGKYACICFTEAPENKFHLIEGRYKPFGVRISKEWLFSQGGRPVIYQSESEYELLPKELKWRHVRYEPNNVLPIDFTWEREWRIKTNELFLPSERVVIILPHKSWGVALEEEQYHNEFHRIWADSVAYGNWAGMQEPEPFHYIYSVL